MRTIATGRPARPLGVDGDEGFTLIELLVSMLLIGLVLSSFLGVTLQAVASNRLAEARTKADQVLAGQLELLQATKWSLTGLFPTECGYWGDPDAGEATVQLTVPRTGSEPYALLGGSCSASAGQGAILRGGISYSVEQHITWADDPADGTGAVDVDYDGTHDEKHFSVKVSWFQAGKTRTLSADAYRTPTTSEVTPRAPKNVGFVLDASATGDQVLSSAYALTAPINLQVTTSTAAGSVQVTYPTRSGTTLPQAMTPDVTFKVWTFALPATTCCFNAGAGIFSFSGSAGALTGNATAQVSLRSANPSYTITGSAQPTTVPLTQSSQLTLPINLSATTSVAVGTVYATYVQNGASVDVNLTPNSARTGWTLSIPAASATFASGPLSVTLTASTSTGDNSVGTTVTLTPYMLPVSINSIALQRGDGSDASSIGICVADNGNNGNYKQYADRTFRATFQNLVTSGSSKDTVTLTWSNLYTTQPVVTPTVVTDTSGVTTYTWTYLAGNNYGFGSIQKNTNSSTSPTLTVKRADGSSAAYPNSPTYNVPNVVYGVTGC